MNELEKLNNVLTPSPLMPVIFVGHGNPMNALENNSYTNEWIKVGQFIPKPQAIIVISAHWLTNGTHITSAPTQPLIYDVYGFPKELYELTYKADGSPEIADELAKSLRQYEAALDNSWGLDHGTWSVLKHLAPEPKIPILQISVDMSKSLHELAEIFSSLQEFRYKGVVFIGSGNIVHNLRYLRFDGKIFDWAQEFDDFSCKYISNRDLDRLTQPAKHTKSASIAMQYDDHYRPMIAALSLIDDSEGLRFFNESLDMGSISMRSFVTS